MLWFGLCAGPDAVRVRWRRGRRRGRRRADQLGADTDSKSDSDTYASLTLPGSGCASTGVTSPRPNIDAHTRFTEARANCAFEGSVGIRANAARNGSPGRGASFDSRKEGGSGFTFESGMASVLTWPAGRSADAGPPYSDCPKIARFELCPGFTFAFGLM